MIDTMMNQLDDARFARTAGTAPGSSSR